MTLQIHTMQLGPLETNCYIVWDEGAAGDANGNKPCWIIDVGMWSKPMVEFLRERNLAAERILLTHCHGDHIGGVEYVKQAFAEAKICCPTAETDMLRSPELNLSATFLMGIVAPHADELLKAGQVLPMGTDGRMPWDVLDTSGHTPGGMSFYCEAGGAVFTGDSLFAGSVGRTDIPRGDHQQLIKNINENLLTLPDETRVYPGHGPATTIAKEKKTNPHLQ